MLAPQGRDSGLACEILRSNRIEAIPCASFDQVFELMSEPVGALLVTEEMLTGAEVHRMAQFLDGQPPWSDLPIVAFASGHDRVRKDAVERIASLGNVSFVDRPVQRRTMIIATRAALRARLRQYEARRAIDARDQFLAMLGHELRNPLGAIVLATELIGLRGQPDPRLTAGPTARDARDWSEKDCACTGPQRHANPRWA